MSKICYLAGPITGESYEGATDWRAHVAGLLDSNIEVLSPMRHKEYLLHETSIADSYNSLMSTQRAITARDQFDCLRSDVVISNLLGASRVSIGTMIEYGWASGNMNKKTLIITVMEKEKNLHDHAMVRELSDWTVDSLDEAIRVTNTILVPGV